jgi:hypothetical protein
MSSLIRRFGASMAVAGLLLAYPGAVGATITGGCTGEGHSTSSSANLTTDTVWHIKKDDVAGGSGTAPGLVHNATVGAYTLGFALPIASGTSDEGKTAGAVDGVSVATYAILGHRFVVSGSGTGDVNCSGQIEIIIDDVNPLLTVLGGGGLVLAIIGLLAVLRMTRGKKALGRRLMDGIFGAVGGLGLALTLEQFGVLDPTQITGLLVVLGAAIVGLLTTGILGGGGPVDGPDPVLSPTM